TQQEADLQDALRESNVRNESQKARMSGMQATAVLSDIYLRASRSQLQAQEEAKGKKKSTRIFSDGLPRLLTDDQVFDTVVQHEHAAAKKKTDKAVRKEARSVHGVAIAGWKKAEEARKARNTARREVHRTAVKAWE
ncbi:uncharacterized protein B0H18DRAFT_817936, partial [Fomitopsis serialis]|uniref:uncharacterized protein n=1 Tax=Fomitopsis serialis TaxID=139415 RepID=UPI0020078B39